MTARDPQDRCDTLYELVASSRWASLAGSSSHEVAELLGPPDRIYTRVHQGVTWTRIVYVCEHPPARASTEERGAHGRGWRFTPSLLLRDGVVVPEARFDEEVVGDRRTAVPPPELQFQEGGRFP